MALRRVLGGSLLCAIGLAGPVSAQDGHRIWREVHTATSDVHEGFIRWDLDETLESDILDGEDLRSGDDMDIRFSQITSIAHVHGLARVVLVNGDEAGCGWAMDRVSDSGRCT
jgi:hypothetical protein